MINFKNVTENLGYIIITNLLTAYIVFTASTSANTEATQTTIESFMPTLDKAIAKHTTAITNAIEIKDNKFKKNDSLNIIIDQKPISTIIKKDSLPVKPIEKPKKKKFLGLF